MRSAFGSIPGSVSGLAVRITGYIIASLSLILGRGGLDAASDLIFGAGLIVLLAGYLADTINKAEYPAARVYESLAMSAGFLCLLLFLLSDGRSVKTHLFMILLESVLAAASVCFWGTRALKNGRAEDIPGRLKGFLKENPGVPLALLFCVIFSIDTFKWIPIWDDHIYAKKMLKLSAWDFTPAGLKTLAGHLSYGADILMMPGAALKSGNGYLDLRYCLFFYVLIAAVLVCLLTERLVPGQSRAGKGLLALSCISFTPFLGMQNTDLDYIALIILVFVMFSYYYRLNSLFMVSALMLCFSVEPMAVLYTGFAFGALLKEHIEHRMKNGGVKPDIRRGVFLFLPVILWIAVFITPMVMNRLMNDGAKAESWGMTVTQGEDGTYEQEYKDPNNGFLIDKAYIASKIYETVVFNYLWVPVLIFVLLTVRELIRRKGSGPENAGEYPEKTVPRENTPSGLKAFILEILPLIFGILGLTAINCAFHTYDQYRYVIQGSFMIAVISLSGICLLTEGKVLRTVILSAITVLFLFQQYYMSDPLTMYKRDVHDSGRGRFVYLDTGKELYMSPAIQVNRQGFDYILLLERILSEIDYDERTLILVPEMNEKENVKSLRGVLYQDHFWYDTENKELITMRDRAEDKTPILWGKIAYNGDVNSLIGWDKSEVEFDRVFLIEFPFVDNDGYLEGLKLQGAETLSEKTVSYRTWSAKVKELSSIDLFYFEKHGSEQ